MRDIRRGWRVAVVSLCAGLLCASQPPAPVAAQDGQAVEEEEVRGLWNDRFKGRRGKGGDGNPRPSAPQKNLRPAPKVSYRHVPYAPPRLPPSASKKGRVPPPAPLTKERAERVVGVTVWRLRPSAPGDAARMLVQDEAGVEKFEMTPVRVEAGSPLAEGDMVRIGIESPTPGYLYVIDREQYANGSLGDPFLIFPTTRTRGGDNRVEAGRLVEIPSQHDDMPYFKVRPSLQRPDQVGELLTIIVSEHPLDLKIGRNPLRLQAEQVLDWETRWESPTTRIEQVGGAGLAWTRAEQEAGRDATRQLVQEEPLPQTIYSVSTRRGDPLIVSLSLPFRRRGAGY